MEKSVLVATYGYLGDIFFASSLADKLKKMGYEKVDYSIGFRQPKPLLVNNPHIDEVYSPESAQIFWTPNTDDRVQYSDRIYLKPLSFLEPPTIEYQKMAGIPEELQSTEYEIHTYKEFDKTAKDYIDKLRKEFGKKVLAVMTGWKLKTYIFTEEEYRKGINVPNKGYGGKHRDTDSILTKLADHFTLIPVGMAPGVSQVDTFDVDPNHVKSITFEASFIKYCDAFIGTEGGLANIAAGVGTRTVLTGDFTHQLYGWNGVIKKIKDGPKLGPHFYFKDVNHVMLDPFLSDEEITNQIIKELN